MRRVTSSSPTLGLRRPLEAVFMAVAVSVALVCRVDAAIINPFMRINQDVTAKVYRGFETLDEDHASATTGMLSAAPGTGHTAGVITASSADGHGNTSHMTLSSSASFGPVNSFRIVGGHGITTDIESPIVPAGYIRSYNDGTNAGLFGPSKEEKANFVYRFEVDQTTRLSAVAIVDRAVGFNTSVELRMGVDDTDLIGGRFGFITPPYPVTERSIMAAIDNNRLPVNSIDLVAGEHTLYVFSAFGIDGGAVDTAFDYGLLFALGGGSELDPILPDGTLAPPWSFTNAMSGLWYDPELTGGYTFQMQSDSLFTTILALPSFLTDPVTISANGAVLGQFGAGQSVDFTGLAGGGVASFSITGINPAVDGDDPLAFPIQLAFNTPIADFSMSPISGVAAVPEPASLLAWSAFALLGLAARAVNRRRT